MKQTKTLAQVANDIEQGNAREYCNAESTAVTVGSFESFGDFLSYFNMHYRPMLERIQNGEDISESDRHLLNFLASDLLDAFKDEDSNESEKERKAQEWQERTGAVNTSWATDLTPEDFEKLTSRYEIADEDRDIVGRRFHMGEGPWTIDVFVSDYAGNEAHALIYLLTGEGEVRANVLSIDHLRQTLTEARDWTRTA